jgi:translation initiation factor IF-3
MKRKAKVHHPKKLRLSVSLDEGDYKTLHNLATSQQPPLSDSYVAAFAIKRFLETVSANRMVIDFSGRNG